MYVSKFEGVLFNFKDFCPKSVLRCSTLFQCIFQLGISLPRCTSVRLTYKLRLQAYDGKMMDQCSVRGSVFLQSKETNADSNMLPCSQKGVSQCSRRCNPKILSGGKPPDPTFLTLLFDGSSWPLLCTFWSCLASFLCRNILISAIKAT